MYTVWNSILWFYEARDSRAVQYNTRDNTKVPYTDLVVIRSRLLLALAEAAVLNYIHSFEVDTSTNGCMQLECLFRIKTNFIDIEV